MQKSRGNDHNLYREVMALTHSCLDGKLLLAKSLVLTFQDDFKTATKNISPQNFPAYGIIL